MDSDALEVPGGFDFRPRTRIVYGAGAVDRLGAIARELGARRALLVSDPGVAAAGHAARATAALESAGLAVSVHAQVREDPTTLDVERGLCAARAALPDLFVAVGGGSSIDTAKGANLLYTNGGEVQDYHGTGLAREPLLPLVAVPTTAGTGSEVQSYALIADEESHRKMACGDPELAPRVALLDPTLTATLPRRVAACTGLDALTHAVETAVTRASNAMSALFSREAFRLAALNLPRVLEPEPELEARGAMLRAACLAGLAIECSMLGAAHSLANPLTARYGLAHGQAVGLMLPHVVRYNAADPAALATYRELAVVAGLAPPSAAPEVALAALVRRLEELLEATGLGASLAALGVAEPALDELAAEAAAQWTARYNPRPVAAVDLRELYRAALR